MIRIYTLHRRDTGVMTLVVLRDTRWRDDRSIIATMEMDLTRGTQMVYVIPDIMMNIEDFANHLELSLQTQGYIDWQGGASNLLITRMMIGRLTITSFTNFAYNVKNVTDYLASRGVHALPGTRFTTEQLQQQRWILRPSVRRNPLTPTQVSTRTLMDGSITLQFVGYTPVPERLNNQVNQDDEEICSPDREILAYLSEEEPSLLKVKKLHPEAVIPHGKTMGATGYDLVIIQSYELNSGERMLLSTGIAVVIPEGYCGRIVARSGVTWKGIQIDAGVIFQDYGGEIKILIFNLNFDTILLVKGEAIAQLIIEKICIPQVIQVENLDETPRGTMGFGSTTQKEFMIPSK
ncbi:uncharacterized protein LOC122053410 isoform X1 [Zingiber officinale]|uniref:uncharacterized protein LOC122053410 isoform X1 n=1 Tax=Zingiber officinale TaxID=94328 RepID=UPI001C4AF195|nr:uncharacterized protein LOC122053410 isoform X1 [Zingiber officinale]XP_042471386.1 uncharacterized protein LOC122053410 isoform X1 [Zingiber officinale]XP_042471387.1 uncharacterized protein LOC122053410 isoform X1 [Zingiber officinale]